MPLTALLRSKILIWSQNLSLMDPLYTYNTQYIWAYNQNIRRLMDNHTKTEKQKREDYIRKIKSEMKAKIQLKNKAQMSKIEKQQKKDMDEIKTTANSPAQLETLDAFNNTYELQQKIDEGTSGVLYQCLHKQNNKYYAAKKMYYQVQHIPFLKQSFYFMTELSHKSLIQYKAFYMNGKKRQIYLIMELFKYPPLSSCKLPLLEEQLQNIAYKIIQAIGYLHSKGICHRDIKPDNILYDRQSGNIKIIDFGVSKKFKLLHFKREMMTGTGTQLYKAPQMITGGFYSELIDLWATGITFFKLITGKTPFQRHKYISKINQAIQKGEIEFEESKWNKYSPFAKNLVERLLKPEKNRPSAEEAKKHLWFSGSQINTVSIHIPSKKKVSMIQQQKFGASCIYLGGHRKVQKTESLIKRLTHNSSVVIGPSDWVESEQQFDDVMDSPN